MMLFLGIGCLISDTASAQTLPPVTLTAAFSPAPLWPVNGDTSAYPSQYVFFHPSANEYLVTYPSPDGKGPKALLHVPVHRLVEPTVTTEVSRGDDGKYHYSYTISNGDRAPTAIDSVMLVLEQRTADTLGQHPTWKATYSAGRPAGVNLNAAGTLRWTSPTGQEIQPGKAASTFTISSDLAPGYALMSFRGKSDLPELDPLQMSRLPVDVQTQLQACKTLGWDTKVKQVIAPRFDVAAPLEAIAVNFRYGLNAADRRQSFSRTSPALVQLDSLLESVALKSAIFNDSLLESLKATATEEQKVAIGALQLTAKYARPTVVDIVQ